MCREKSSSGDAKQHLAHEIIDLVEIRLRELYPDIELMASQLEENTLLVGENYYDLENEVAELLASSEE